MRNKSTCNYAREARKVVNYINTLTDSFLTQEIDNSLKYNHIGALITDIILQAGLNYNTVVKPRVQKILLHFPEAETVIGFQKLIGLYGLQSIIYWDDAIKLGRINAVIDFLSVNKVNTCIELKNYLTLKGNQQQLLDLKGIGPKTVDYLLKLLGFDTVAVDRHIVSFIRSAGVNEENYMDIKKTVEYAADIM